MGRIGLRAVSVPSGNASLGSLSALTNSSICIRRALSKVACENAASEFLCASLRIVNGKIRHERLRNVTVYYGGTQMKVCKAQPSRCVRRHPHRLVIMLALNEGGIFML